MDNPQQVRLDFSNDIYEIVLMNSEGERIGHGYRGPSKSRADQDLKYWTRTKGLALSDTEELAD